METGRRRYEVLPVREGESPVECPSMRALTRHLHGRDLHWTHDRYFRLGRYERWNPTPITPSLDLLAIADPTKPAATTRLYTCEEIVVATPAPVLGIDLAARGHEVAKLLFAGFGHKILASGYEFKDVLQEVYKGILTRNRGRCPFDARKSSFGHYVHMVSGCILMNYHRQQSRRTRHEQIGAPGYDANGNRTTVDVAQSEVAQLRAYEANNQLDSWSAYLETLAAEELLEFIQGSPKSESTDAALMVQVLPLVREGNTRAEIALHLDVSRATISRALAFLRAHTKRWQEFQAMSEVST